jgi:AraC-like DNA-binding protein
MILLSVFSFLLIQTFSKNTIKNINSNTENMVYQSYTTADVLLSSAYTNFYNLYSSDTNIINALYANDLNILQVRDICNLLQVQVRSNPIINSIYIYNRKADKVVTSMPSVSNIDNFIDTDIIKKLDNFKDYNKNIIPREITYDYLGNTYNYKFISLIFYDYNVNSAMDSAMIINIDQDVFQKLVTSSKNKGITELFIIDNNGVVISHTDPKMINSNLKNEAYISRILLSTTKDGYFTNKANEDTSIISYVKSTRLGWTFVGKGEYKNLLSNFQEVRNYVILITILFIIIGVIIAAYFTTNIYKPLYKILSEIKSKNKDTTKALAMNEYDYLATTFHSLVDNNARLESNIHEYSFARKHELLLQILNGKASNTINAELLKDCDIKLNSGFYCVVVIKLDSIFKLYTNYTASDLSIFKFAILNISFEVLRGEFKTEGMEDGSDNVCLIIDLKNDNSISMDTLKLLIEEVHFNIQKYLKFTVTSAVGNVVYDYFSIHDSYINALYSSGYRMITGQNSVILYSDFASRRSLTQDYPYDIEKQLISSLKQRNEKKTEENLDEFFDYIKSYNPDEILMSVSQLMMIIVRTFTNLESFDLQGTGITFTNLNEGLKKHDTLNEMQEYIQTFLMQIINCKINTHNIKQQELINSIIEYLNNNFNDPNISVELIADKVSLSVNYLRTIFKEITNKSLSDYLLELRIEKAKELLLSTEYTAKDISQMVGYTTTRYFYVVFKKFSGMTAEEFRKTAKR